MSVLLPPTLATLGHFVGSCCCVRVGSLAAHEWVHVGVATLLGLERAFTFENVLVGALLTHRVSVLPPTRRTWQVEVVRHSGWLGSVLLALTVTLNRQLCFSWGHPTAVLLAVWWTALDAVASDALQQPPSKRQERHSALNSNSSGCVFFCGNFGVVLFNFLSQAHRDRVMRILQKMTEITMMRGAQSGGVATYLPDGSGDRLKGSRSRVVNKKRSDLSRVLMARLRADMARRSLLTGPPQSPSVFQGTRALGM